MRKITSEACRAFEQGYEMKSENTSVVLLPGGIVYLELHGHPIAKRDIHGLYVRSAGWETSTTKERINGLVGVHVIQKAGQWYLNGKKWENTSEWTKVESN